MARLPNVRLRADTLRLGRNVSISFQRTLRIPDDGRAWPLPPGLGCFPIRKIADYAKRVPTSWLAEGGVFLPMYQREAMWISFSGADWRPNAVKIGVGGVDAVSGAPWNRALCAEPEQDYVVVPDQPWLDGINAGAGFIRQFVAAPLGQGVTVEAQVSGTEEGGLRLAVFEPKPGRFPARAPRRRAQCDDAWGSMMTCESPAVGLGLAAGGKMRQQIYPDTYGLDTWDLSALSELRVHIVTTKEWTAITREAPPPSPVSAESYLACGLPWFDLYDEHRGDIAAPDALRKVKSWQTLEQDDRPTATASSSIAQPPTVWLHP